MSGFSYYSIVPKPIELLKTIWLKIFGKKYPNVHPDTEQKP